MISGAQCFPALFFSVFIHMFIPILALDRTAMFVSPCSHIFGRRQPNADSITSQRAILCSKIDGVSPNVLQSRELVCNTAITKTRLCTRQETRPLTAAVSAPPPAPRHIHNQMTPSQFTACRRTPMGRSMALLSHCSIAHHPAANAKGDTYAIFASKKRSS